MAVAKRADGALELFGLGLDGRAFAANFNNSGNLANGWFRIDDNQPIAYTQIVAATLVNGNMIAFGLGSDQHPFDATFGLSGTKQSGWTQLATNAFRLLAAGSQGGNARLFAIDANDATVDAMVFDSTGTLNSGFFAMPNGQFAVVAVAA